MRDLKFSSFATPLLSVSCLLSVIGLAYQWVGLDGQLRDLRWAPPAPLLGSIDAAVLRNGATAEESDIARFVAILDRPMFAPTRRPPPPPPPPVPPPPVDPLGSIQLMGVYGGSSAGGIIARIDGKVQRVKLNDNVGPWTIKGIAGRDVTFANGDETRTLTLRHVIAARPPTNPALPAGDAGSVVRPDLSVLQQREQAETARRMDERRELFKKMGIPMVGKE